MPDAGVWSSLLTRKRQLPLRAGLCPHGKPWRADVRKVRLLMQAALFTHRCQVPAQRLLPRGTAPSLPGRSRPLVLPQIVRRGRCRVQGDMLVAELVLLDGQPALTREQAMALKGVELQVDRADFPPADEDEFYHADLIGCEVIGQGGARLGTVVAVDDHGAQQVLRLDDGLLIPFVEAIVTTVDLAARRIEVDWAADWR